MGRWWGEGDSRSLSKWQSWTEEVASTLLYQTIQWLSLYSTVVASSKVGSPFIGDISHTVIWDHLHLTVVHWAELCSTLTLLYSTLLYSSALLYTRLYNKRTAVQSLLRTP